MQHRVALIGAGMIAQYHVTKWREAGAEVVAVADVQPEVLETFARDYEIPTRYSEYTEMLRREEAADIVDVCTPPWLHARMTIAALERGRHVLCEKPMALNAGEADAMAEAADAAGKVLACRQGDTRLARQARSFREVVDSGVLGDIYFMRLISRALYRPGIEYNPEARWFLDRSKAGGGVLYDWGVYDLELLFSAFGPFEIENVTSLAFTSVDRPPAPVVYDVEEHSVALLSVKDGPTIYWERGWATHLPPENRWDLYGTRAGFSFVPHSAVLGTEMDPQLTQYGPGRPVHLPLAPLPERGPDVFVDFLAAVEGEHPPACSGREAAAMLHIIDAVYAAARRVTA